MKETDEKKEERTLREEGEDRTLNYQDSVVCSCIVVTLLPPQ
jgi:hypothetical protein